MISFLKISMFYLLIPAIIITSTYNNYINKIKQPTTINCKVIGIKDGDTFEVLFNNKKLVVRLAHIDCPERKQPFYQNAKQYASSLCFGKNVTLVHNNNFDRNKRLIAEVYIGTLNINKNLVKSGLAWHFKKYSNNTEYAIIEMEAKRNKIGIWSENNPIAPWEWRKAKKKNY